MKKFILFRLVIIGILTFYAAIANALSSSAQIAIGHYTPTTPSTNPWHQAIILHHNDDASWSTQNIPWEENPSSSIIYDTTCTEKNCIATVYNLVGGYGFIDTPYQYKGFILISLDNGESWSFINKKPAGDKNERITALNAVTCTNNICIIGGNNDDGLNFFISHDHGVSWSPIQSISGMKEVPNIDKIQCSENDCIVFGSFVDKQAGHPIAILSHDKGETWSANKNILNFPKNIYELRFTDIK
jgi:hypothetical protein